MNDSNDVWPPPPSSQPQHAPTRRQGPSPEGIWAYRLFLASVVFLASAFVFGFGGSPFFMSLCGVCTVVGVVCGGMGFDTWQGRTGLWGSWLILLIFVLPFLFFAIMFSGGLHGD
ncbi:MAG: hypothetical protein JWQ02_2050 [Capsulimonas sp.]|nr:hypothetical protein [Capsulimonas sp.]